MPQYRNDAYVDALFAALPGRFAESDLNAVRSYERERGREEGRRMMRELFQRLKEDGRMEDYGRALLDPDHAEKCMEEYGIRGDYE